MKQKFLPIFLDISKKNIFIIGGGRIALQKIKMLKQFTNKITVIAPEILPDIIGYKIKIVRDVYQKKYLKKDSLVYACTDDRKLNEKIKKEAENLNILVNVVDNPNLCHFITPAILKKGNMAVAISSNGTNVKKTIKWRNKIKDIF